MAAYEPHTAHLMELTNKERQCLERCPKVFVLQAMDMQHCHLNGSLAHEWLISNFLDNLNSSKDRCAWTLVKLC